MYASSKFWQILHVDSQILLLFNFSVFSVYSRFTIILKRTYDYSTTGSIAFHVIMVNNNVAERNNDMRVMRRRTMRRLREMAETRER